MDCSWLYGFKCGNVEVIYRSKPYVMLKIGIVYTATFDRVLRRFYQEHMDFRKDLDLNVCIPVKTADDSITSPSSGTTLNSAIGQLYVGSLEELISALDNQKKGVGYSFSNNIDDILLQYDDLMFILPFQPDVDKHEIKQCETICRYAFGGAILSDFTTAVTAHKELLTPTNSRLSIPSTELVLSSTDLFMDTRELFIANALGSAQFLLKSIPKSTFDSLHTTTADGNTTMVELVWYDRQSPPARRTIQCSVKMPIYRDKLHF
jgi:hypothetical protein